MSPTHTLPTIVALIAVALIAGCSASRTGHITTTSATPATSTTTTTTELARDAACQVVSWNDLPRDVWPQKLPPTVDPRPADPGISDCRLDNSLLGTGTKETDHPTISVDVTEPRLFVVHVKLGDLATDPIDYSEGEATTVAGHPGALLRDKTRNDPPVPRCLVAFRTATPQLDAAVQVVNNRFDHDVCAIAKTVAASIAPRIHS